MRPIILSPFMANIPVTIRQAQKDVVDRFRGDVPFLQCETTKPHGETLDELTARAFDAGYDTVMFIDIDAIPLQVGIPLTLQAVEKIGLVGNIQRSNHINNGAHLFVAPSFMAFTKQAYLMCGSPSFVPTKRGDVGEEFTYRFVERKKYPATWIPLQCETPQWDLRLGMPRFGPNTTFGTQNGIGVSFHAFQIRQGNERRFLEVCKQMMGAALPDLSKVHFTP